MSKHPGAVSTAHRQDMVRWITKFSESGRYKTPYFLNIYYPKLGKPFLKEQEYCLLVDYFPSGPLGLITKDGYKYTNRTHLSGRTDVSTDNPFYAEQIYKLYVCLKETIYFRLGQYNLDYTEAFRHKEIVESFCNMIINEWNETLS